MNHITQLAAFLFLDHINESHINSHINQSNINQSHINQSEVCCYGIFLAFITITSLTFWKP